uniref:very low-density lipoprotein receptor-like n=1 Tax=Myxine glutinosa TaxID=7769 RepID=UPI00358DDFAF
MKDNTSTEVSTLHKAAKILWRDYLHMKQAFKGSFLTSCETESIAPTMKSFLHTLLDGPGIDQPPSGSEKSKVVTSIWQQIIFNSVGHRSKKPDSVPRHIRDRKTPASLYMAMKVHLQTSRKSLINDMHQRGHASPASSSCDPTQLACANGRCVPVAWRCDRDDDCGDGTDERHCMLRTCGESEFTCRDGDCVPAHWMCDGQSDCEHGEDENEVTCDLKTCPPNSVPCWREAAEEPDGRDEDAEVSSWIWNLGSRSRIPGTRGHSVRRGFRCLPSAWVCDGFKDCSDSSDEESCDSKVTSSCPSDYVACENGHCIPAVWRCDGDDDCGDWTDEQGCQDTPHSTPNNPNISTPRLFRFKTNKAYNSRGLNTNTSHPPELESKLKQDEKLTEDTDRMLEKGENEDERRENEHTLMNENKCSGFGVGCHSTMTAPLSCPRDSWHCADGRCAGDTGQGKSRVQGRCDGVLDCQDGSDETRCNKTDINECTKPGLCSQICTNTKGSYKCSCLPGYGRGPRGRCRALNQDGWLVFTNRRDVRGLRLGAGSEYARLLSGSRNAASLAAWPARGLLYWSDLAQAAVYRQEGTKGSERIGGRARDQGGGTRWNRRREKVVEPRLTKKHKEGGDGVGVLPVCSGARVNAEGLAVDWLGSRLFWTDGHERVLCASRADGTRPHPLVTRHLSEPRALSLLPHRGYVYWSDWGKRAVIERVGMDGQGREQIVSDGVAWPNGLVIDSTELRLYWVDSKLHSLSSIDLEGHSRRLVLHSPSLLGHPISIALFEDEVYWTDGETEAVMRANKFTGFSVNRLVEGLNSPQGLLVYHELLQPPGVDLCSIGGLQDGGCSYLCLPSPQPPGPAVPPFFSCLCPSGFHLGNDGHTCTDTALGSETENITLATHVILPTTNPMVRSSSDPQPGSPPKSKSNGKSRSWEKLYFSTILFTCRCFLFIYCYISQMLNDSFCVCQK